MKLLILVSSIFPKFMIPYNASHSAFAIFLFINIQFCFLMLKIPFLLVSVGPLCYLLFVGLFMIPYSLA